MGIKMVTKNKKAFTALGWDAIVIIILVLLTIIICVILIMKYIGEGNNALQLLGF